MSTRVIQILPRLPPAICGVADQSVQIGNRLESDHGCEVCYIAARPLPDSTSDAHRIFLRKRSATELFTVMESLYQPRHTVIFLQFSGYGFARWGLCYWVVQSIKRFLKRHPDVRLLTMFHELWATGPLTSSAGWTTPFQRGIVRSLVKLSSEVRTNRAEYARMIRKVAPDYNGPLTVQPVFSNFGEPSAIPEWSQRKNQIVAFQPPAFGSEQGESYWKAWEQLVESLKPDSTVVAGRAKAVPDRPQIEKRGVLSAVEASRLLTESRFALVQYFDGYLGKSSLLASIAAHGMVCFMPAKNHSEADGLQHRVHYLLPNDDLMATESLIPSVGHALLSWYSSHDLNATALSYADSIARMRT